MLKTFLIFVVLSGAFFGAHQLSASQSARGLLAGRVIVLDAGHAVKNVSGSVINPGASSRAGTLERDVALSVATKAAALLEAYGAKVYLTRTADNPWRYAFQKTEDNRSRAIFANVMRAQAYVRIHCDWNRSKRFEGVTTYYYRWGSRELAKGLHRAMVAAVGRRDNGVKRRSFVSITARMPTALLEIGVLSNPAEAKLLPTEEYQMKIAESIVRGLADYFAHKERGQILRLDEPAHDQADMTTEGEDVPDQP